MSKQWQLLHKLQKEGVLSHVDLLFARKAQDPLLSALLFALARAGHLILELTPEGIDAALKQLGTADPLLPALIGEAAEKIPQVDPGVDYPFNLLCRHGSSLYLQKNWVFESKIVSDLIRLQKAPPSCIVQKGEISSLLNTAQTQAVESAITHSVSLLTGGPGTGKTFTAAQIVQAIWTGTPPEQREEMQIVLAAPTGKAVAQLQAGMRKLCNDAIHIKAATLHSLLGIKNNRSGASNEIPLYADLIIVDECSMVDFYVFAKLLEKVASGTRLVLIGDRHQLPPVEAGSIFADLIESGAFACSELVQSLRSDRQEILSFSQLLKEGKAEEAIQVVSGTDLKRVDLSGTTLASLWQQCRHFYPSTESDPEAALTHIKRFCLLSCTRKGPLGADEINRFFFQQAMKEQWQTSPIMIMRNHDELELYNGDQGVLIRAGYSPHLTTDDYAYFPDRSGGFRKIPALALPAFEYCYCLSVHKSQGSEYDEISILAPEGSESFGREVLYTAVTRARCTATLAASDSLLRAALSHSSRKTSGIKSRLLVGDYQ